MFYGLQWLKGRIICPGTGEPPQRNCSKRGGGRDHLKLGLGLSLVSSSCLLTATLGFSEIDKDLNVKPSYQLITACLAPDCQRDLKGWDFTDTGRLKELGLKKKVSWEKDPLTGKMVKWEGVLLSQVVEKTLNELSLEHRAQIDLLILKGKSGVQAVLPRALASKYPILLATNWDSRAASPDIGPIYSVIPWTSKPKILKEDLPLQKYFVPQLNRIELTNYRQLYNPFYLKRRTDPSAMRGEKIFVQNCISCHTTQPENYPEKNKKFHNAMVQGAPNLKDQDHRSVWRYLEEFQRENPSRLADRARSTKNNLKADSGERGVN